ncbi:Ankyrin repeat domain-containing protein 29 [Durusdinium trenchii]|uniref:Ankyrin repeat domain-containing protein 29 n=1 Tax=Durusdinium trenchii TaxID=1381693 RepID=A0ABP0N9C7_9DINO
MTRLGWTTAISKSNRSPDISHALAGWVRRSPGGHEAIVTELLQNDSDANQLKHDQTSPLYIACQNGHSRLVPHLLEQGASVNHQNQNGATPLFIACQKGHNGIVRKLLEKRADPELALASHATPLYIASSKGHLGIVRELLAIRANANTTPRHETTPLSVSVQNKHAEVATCLLGATVNININKGEIKGGLTALHFAIIGQEWEIASALIAHGANPEQKDKHGRDSWKLAEGVPEGLLKLRGIQMTRG